MEFYVTSKLAQNPSVFLILGPQQVPVVSRPGRINFIFFGLPLTTDVWTHTTTDAQPNGKHSDNK